jgi:hypothetical protein
LVLHSPYHSLPTGEREVGTQPPGLGMRPQRECGGFVSQIRLGPQRVGDSTQVGSGGEGEQSCLVRNTHDDEELRIAQPWGCRLPMVLREFECRVCGLSDLQSYRQITPNGDIEL